MELSPQDNAWLHETVLVYNRSEDREWRAVYAKKAVTIGPKKMANVPRWVVMLWVGNPRLKSDATQWHREVSRLKYQIGEGTSHFDYWLAGGKLACPDFQNHVPGFYGTTGFSDAKWEEIGSPIPAHYNELPELPKQPMLVAFDDAEFENYDRIVRERVGGNRPDNLVGEAFGGETSVDEDLSKSFEVARMTNTPGANAGGRDRVVTGKR